MKETRPTMFGRYLTAYQKQKRGDAEPLQVALVLGGTKPATLFDPPAELFSQCSLDTRGLLKQWGLHYRSTSGFSGVVVSPSAHWLDLLPTVNTDMDAYARRLGLLFGYPLPDIDNYLHTDGSAYTPLKYVSQDVFSADEVAYISFTFYRPEDSIAGYERAIAIGKRNYIRLHELSDRWDLPLLATMTEQWYSGSVASYSPDEYPPERLNEILGSC